MHDDECKMSALTEDLRIQCGFGFVVSVRPFCIGHYAFHRQMNVRDAFLKSPPRRARESAPNQPSITRAYTERKSVS